MTDWLTIVAHGLWIAGLSLILAALSYHYWLAGQAGRSLRQQVAVPSFQRPFLAGLLLVGAGLTGISGPAWQMALAATAALGAVIALVLLRRA